MASPPAAATATSSSLTESPALKTQVSNFKIVVGLIKEFGTLWRLLGLDIFLLVSLCLCVLVFVYGYDPGEQIS